MAFSLMGIITVVLEVFRGVLPFVLLWVVVDLVLLGLFFARKSSRSVNLALPVKPRWGLVPWWPWWPSSCCPASLVPASPT